MRTATAVICLVPTFAAAEPPRLVADIAPIHSIAAAVMEGVGTPDLIVPTTASPHGYSLRPSEARALEAADLVVWVGPSLAPWMDGPIDALASDAHVVTLLDVPGTELLDIREGASFAAGHEGHDHGHDDHGDDEAKAEDDDHAGHDHDDHGDEDHAKAEGHDDHDDHAGHDHDDHGDEDHAKAEGQDDHKHEDHAGHDHDEHGHEDHAHADGKDPHAWLDPRNAAIWADAIAVELAELDPENADTYIANARAFRKDLAILEIDVAEALAPVAGKPFVVFHDAYHYFEHRFDIEAVGAISASDAASPSAGRVAEVREAVEDLGAICALTEPQFNPGIANAIGAAKLGVVDPIGATLTPGPDLYPALLRGMAAALADCTG